MLNYEPGNLHNLKKKIGEAILKIRNNDIHFCKKNCKFNTTISLIKDIENNIYNINNSLHIEAIINKVYFFTNYNLLIQNLNNFYKNIDCNLKNYLYKFIINCDINNIQLNKDQKSIIKIICHCWIYKYDKNSLINFLQTISNKQTDRIIFEINNLPEYNIHTKYRQISKYTDLELNYLDFTQQYTYNTDELFCLSNTDNHYKKVFMILLTITEIVIHKKIFCHLF